MPIPRLPLPLISSSSSGASFAAPAYPEPEPEPDPRMPCEPCDVEDDMVERDEPPLSRLSAPPVPVLALAVVVPVLPLSMRAALALPPNSSRSTGGGGGCSGGCAGCDCRWMSTTSDWMFAFHVSSDDRSRKIRMNESSRSSSMSIVRLSSPCTDVSVTCRMCRM